MTESKITEVTGNQGGGREQKKVPVDDRTQKAQTETTVPVITNESGESRHNADCKG